MKATSSKKPPARKTTAEPRRWYARASIRLGLLAAAYIAIWLLASYLFYRRFPDNYRNPNFYAEDGKVFASNLINHGFWTAFFTTFNGYYIWGLYLLEKVGFIVNDLLYGGQFVDLPRAFSLVSYGFLGLMAILPLALLRKYIKLPALILIALLVTYVPLRGSDYTIIGAIGNLKFAFLYLAFLLLCYRHLMPEKSKKIYLVDLGLLLCAYTDITVYAMMLFALARYWPKFNFRQALVSLKDLLLHSQSFQSLVGLGVLMLPQLYIVKHDGVPVTPGYLTNGFNFHRTIEIFVSRSYLYDILFPINKHLGDIIVVIVFLLLAGLAWRGARRWRQFLVFGGLTILAGTFLFVVKRTGVSDFFIGYKDSGPDQFFYAQNWVFSFIFVIALVEVVQRIKSGPRRTLVYVILAATAVFYLAPNASSYGTNTFMGQTVGNIYAVGQKDCRTSAKTFQLNIYPAKGWLYPNASRQQVCTSATIHYQAQDVSLGLAPVGNNYLMVANTSFTQTFKSPDNNLDGLDVFFSTFLQKVKTPYKLELLDASCKQQLASVNVAVGGIADNSFATVVFPTIQNSAGQIYCFTVKSLKTPSSPLAVQLSAADAYPTGQTKVDGAASPKSIVFELHYK
jgi:hypothetical protein